MHCFWRCNNGVCWRYLLVANVRASTRNRLPDRACIGLASRQSLVSCDMFSAVDSINSNIQGPASARSSVLTP